MTTGGTTRAETLAKLAQSRADIRRVLDPPPREESATSDGAASNGDEVFPRSRTMKLLMSGRGLSTAGAVVGGLLMARPALALRLLRMIPTGALARVALVKAITAFRARHS